ncbi:universal stress protein [Conexibacter sp. S30A1]|jgi:nucleotide-binding universal stress UspA family protein|uniref:universal stress protein n=1 Tax=Conexibacter sp. S30A1 TaxID=2937800 RepID=UPI00200C42EB|nr:universal stress protein [Conexibacter sp. S30A1]
MILIGHDGSEDSKAAIEQAAKLFPGQQAIVLTVWQRFIDTMARAGAGMAIALDLDEMDSATEKSAAEAAQAGAELARQAGLDATPQTAVVTTTVGEAILGAAAQAHADAIVCGSHGRSELRSLMLGSVSRQLLHHAEIPVVVVPSPAVATARAERRRRMEHKPAA